MVEKINDNKIVIGVDSDGNIVEDYVPKELGLNAIIEYLEQNYPEIYFIETIIIIYPNFQMEKIQRF